MKFESFVNLRMLPVAEEGLQLVKSGQGARNQGRTTP
jgi:hypothetical protein